MKRTYKLENWISNISSNRISQLKNHIENPQIVYFNTEISKKISEIFGGKWVSRSYILEEIQKKEFNLDKTTQKQLRKFLSNFISNLSQNELTQTYRILEYFQNIYQEIFWQEEEIYNNQNFPLIDILQNLLTKWVLLPQTQNQKDFDEEMNWIIARLKKKLEKESSQKWLVINPIDIEEIQDYMEYNWIDHFSTNQKLNWVIDEIRFAIINWENLIDVDPEYLEENMEYCNFLLTISNIRNPKISKEKIINDLKEEWYKEIEKETFLLKSSFDLNTILKIYTPRIKSTTEGEEEKFIIEIYSDNVRNIDPYTYFEQAVHQLSREVEKITNKIYQKYWYPEIQNRINIEDKILKDSDNWEIDEEEIEEQWTNKTSTHEKIEKWKIPEIILWEKEKEELDIIIKQFWNEKHFEKYGIEIPKGILLYWPPWTGKTLFAEVIAKSTDSDFRIIDSTKIHTMRAWMSEKNLKNEFEQAKKTAKQNKKIILFFDEADWMFPKRSDAHTTKEWMISTILQEMDWIKKEEMKNIMIFLTTNKSNSLDPALIDRCDKKLKIDIPDKKKIKEILKLYIKEFTEKSRFKLFEDNLDTEKIAQRLEWKSWRFINKTIKNSVSKIAFKRVNEPDYPCLKTEDIIKEIEKLELEKETQKRIGII